MLGTIIATIAGSSVIAAAIGFLGKLVSDWLQRKQRATYLALRAALHLERYTAELVRQVPIAQAFDTDAAHDPEYQGEYPKLPEFPNFSSELDWHDLDPKLTARCLSFETEIYYARIVIGQAYDADDDIGLQELKDQLPLRADRSAGLAQDLRQRYGLPELTAEDLAGDSSRILARNEAAPA